MADNVIITPGVGATIATDDVGGVQVQKVKIAFGGDGKLHELSSQIINVAVNGDNDIVAAGGVGIVSVIYGFWLVAAGAVNVKWKDGAASDFHPVVYLTGQGASWMLPRDGKPWYTGTANTKIILNLSGAVQVSGTLYYGQS